MNLTSNALRLTLKLAVCLVLVAWILHVIFAGEAEMQLGKDWGALSFAKQLRESWTIGPTGLWKTISGVSLGWLLTSFVFMGTTIFIGVIRWRTVLAVQGLYLPLGRAAGISLVAHFFNSFLLGSTGGDLLKAYYSAAETNHKKAEAVTTVVVDRLLGLFAMLLFVSLMALANWSVVMSQQRFMAVMLVVLGMLFVSGLVVVLSFWAGPTGARLKFETLLAKLPKGDVLVRCIEACHAFGENPGFLPRVLGWSMLLSLACVLQIVALGHGLGLPMGEHFRVLLLIVPAIICISALPITPSGIGVRENLYVWLLSATAIGIEAKTALSLSLLAFAGSLLWSLIGGATYLAFRSRHSLDQIATD
ncbi:MAG: lysylphosphatidylglycerol synthase transmembrane domain-containing protein [Verrucomicrobiota bacterium]|nr:lysylphosphatidylglycerol synthase transmembrane domain-containing protein [Verrucomicrobiota bacterium]MDP6251657.1 lysylphosphatidylglycerol synthase transmembrane domain-containing protein [Verrucomicrobiota bacterium]MDP7177296.1 lysylphosphatidylglycerol synthase transmembrane domain-containing protein [Verrucomicrobiota bacterium]MDP7290849.1 lysylphosphatidylglycerol synthase transmembrane domain-containing protein [Verrucomicrobiota bacterium]MDP7440460.1 lysylphosphatidylglycerol sy